MHIIAEKNKMLQRFDYSVNHSAVLRRKKGNKEKKKQKGFNSITLVVTSKFLDFFKKLIMLYSSALRTCWRPSKRSKKRVEGSCF